MGRQVAVNIGRCCPKGYVEEGPGCQSCRIPPGRSAVVGDGHKGPTHAKCSAANGFDKLS
jgi:hypothetical protein